MVNNEEERKALMDTIRILLRTTEELKTSILPLIRDQEDILKILKSHEEAITRLMDKLIGTKEDHEKRLKALELVRTHVSKLEEERETHEVIHAALEKRLKRIEFEPINQILKKIRENEVTVSDLKVVEDVLSLHPDDEQLLKVKILVLERIGREQEALEFVEEAISKHSKNAWLWHRKGMLLIEVREDFDETLKCYDKSLELLKEGPPLGLHNVYFSRASLFANAERFEEALDGSTKAVEANPDCPAGWLQKGMILVELGRIPEALGCFEKAIELDKDFKEAWFEKGIALSALGSNYYDEAMACFDKAIELDSKWAIAYFNRGKLFGAKDQDEKALQNIDKGLEFNDKEPCAWCDRGVALNRLGRNQEAIESFERALELGPPKKCNQIFQNIAIVLYYLGRHKEGAEFAKRIVGAEPENVRFWDVFACNLQRLGRDEEALKAFEKALSLRKSDEEISWDDLAELYKRMGRTKEAEQAYQKFKSIEKSKIPNNVEEE